MGYAIRASHLTKDFDSFKLDDVTLELPGGAVMGLIGENGAGKSTLIKCLLGILRPTAGGVELLGLPGTQALGEVGYVPDACPFAPAMKVGQVGDMLAGMYPSWDGGLWESWARRFGLPQGARVRELSRGMEMKLSIAAALSHRPRLLVLDEATAGLDPVARDELLDVFLAFVADEEHAILLSSHITSDLEKVCDYVTYLHKGRVTVAGAKDELLERYGKVTCTRAQMEELDPAGVVGKRVGQFQCQALVSDRGALRGGEWVVETPTLEDIMIFTTRGGRA